MEKKFIQINEASKLLGVTKLTLRNWDNAGKLTAYRHPMNNYRVYKVEDIERLIHSLESGAKPNINNRRNSPLSKKKNKLSSKTYNLKDLLKKD